jgi:type II secretion system protein E
MAHGDPESLYKDYRKEMEALIKGEAGKHEETVGRSVMEKGEAGTKLAPEKAGPEFAGTRADMLQMLSEQAGLPYVDLTDYPVENLKILKYIPAEIARTYKVFPLREEPDGTIVVAISDPLNITIVDDLRLLLDKNVSPVVANETDIMEYIDRYYGIGDETIEKMVEEFDKEDEQAVVIRDIDEMDLSDLERIAHEPPVIRLVNLVLLQAIKDRASDLHVEPFGGILRIRYRVDGVLREIPSPPKSLQLGLCSRLKVLANMNIAETRMPQDGRIRLTLSGREIDLRVSSIPTVHGESIVLRILDRSIMMLGIEQLGMTKDTLEKFRKLIRKPNGIVLVTGPTGCGKTTTLYAALNEINDPGYKIITTEDPVEYEVPGIIQVNINPQVGLNFAICLRHIVRQDPDIILVGEVRDLETAQISIQASLTGHLVFSTLHTNSAAATITRLIDMGVEPFLITSTLEAIMGQRLIRTLCLNCRRPYTPTPEELEDFGATPEDVRDITFYKGAGCDDCAYTGYKGRLGIFELLVMTDEIRELVLQRATTDQLHAMAVHQGMSTMRNDGWLKICLGVTTFEEVARQTPKETKDQISQEMEEIIQETIRKVKADRDIRSTRKAQISEEETPAPPPPVAKQPWEHEAATSPNHIGDAKKAPQSTKE